MASNFCPNCGSPIKSGIKFCGKCGQKINTSTENKASQNISPNKYPQQILPPNPNTSQKEKSSYAKYILGGIIGALVILVIVFGIKAMNNNSSDIAQTDSSAVTSSASSDITSSEPITTVEQTKPVISAELMPYIEQKDQYDKDISNLASDINAHVSKYGDFKNDNGLVRRGATISTHITQTKEAVRNLNDNSPAKDKLLELLDLETVRVESLIQGMISTKTGGDYAPGFKKGTDAAYKFDDVNAEFNKMKDGK